MFTPEGKPRSDVSLYHLSNLPLCLLHLKVPFCTYFTPKDEMKTTIMMVTKMIRGVLPKRLAY